MLALFVWHRFGREDRSDVAAMLLLFGVLVSGIAFAQIADDRPAGLPLASQLLVSVAGFGIHLWAIRNGSDDIRRT